MDAQRYTHVNNVDEMSRPAGGRADGIGITIEWQNGPLGRFPDRADPNGAFVEDIIRIAAERIEFYQQSQFASLDNAVALGHLQAALTALNFRTLRRELAGVEGTHEGT